MNWLASQCWGWARYIYNQSHSNDLGEREKAGYQRLLIDWLPRIYAMVAFVAAYRAAIHAQVDNIAEGILIVAILVLTLIDQALQVN